MGSDDQPPPSCVSDLHAPLTQLTVARWDQWGLEIPTLVEVRSPADLHQWLQHAKPEQADALLAGFARLAATDDLALAALAWLLTGVLTIAGTHSPDPPPAFLQRARAALRTIPPDGVAHVPTYVLTQLTSAPPGPTVLQPRREPARRGWDQPTLF